MGSGGWRIASGLLIVPAVVGGLAGCGGGGGHPAATPTSSGGFSTAKLQGALLTRINGVGAVAPPSSGRYSSVSKASAQKPGAGSVQVSPRACSGAATERFGFDPTALAAEPAAAVTFRIGTNGVSEVLIASSPASASTALAGRVPAECTQYRETIGGKTYKYGVKEQPVTGIGVQAKVLNVHAIGATADEFWSLIYRGKGFVGTVTVVGPNASEQAVQELGEAAYDFAAKSLS
jgi:hypothetical protein